MKLASIEEIVSAVPHPNADRLDLIGILGWQLIAARGEFRPGDRAVFVPIDALVPRRPWSEFLFRKEGEEFARIRTIKLRGEFSQGLALPLSVLPEHIRGWQIGADVGCELGVRKYEKQLPAQLSGVAKCPFPVELAARTDEDNGLSYPRIVEKVLAAPRIDVSLKLDGSSMTVIVENGAISHVCSRNLSLEPSDSNAFHIAAKKLKLPYGVPHFVAQGELMGPGIQGNQLELLEPAMHLFQAQINGHYMDRVFLRAMAEMLELPIVPSIYSGPPMSLDALREMADSVTLPNGKPAEGIVVRTSPPTTYIGNGRPLGFKLINRNYKDTE